jgi:tellurite resistance protein
MNSNRIIKRISGWLVTAAALLLLQACSAIKLAYNNAPEFAYWWLDGYVDFQSDQSFRTREELNKLLAWHRAEELPKIAELLRKIQPLAMADLTASQVCALFEESRGRYEAVTRQAEPAAVWLVMGLQASQLTHIESKFSKINDQWRKDWLQLTAAERFEKRLKSNTERAEEFYGKLEDRQVAALRGALEASQFDATMNMTERQRRQQDLLQTLRRSSAAVAGSAKPAASEVLTQLRAYRERVTRSPSAAYQAYSDKLTQESCTSFAALHNSTTVDQRKRAVGRIAAYERDARELNSQR